MSFSNTKAPYSKPSSYINLNCFNYSSDPVDSLDAILEENWQIKSLEISSHGNNGVVFLETSIGSFVLKMNNQAPADLFFNKFAALLDVNVPEIKIVSCYDDFFARLVFQIEKFCQKDECLSARLRKRMDFPFYQIMEYIPSISFLEVGPQRFKKHQRSGEKMHNMGICIGFDLIVNNNDRFKLSKIWGSGNEGNIANILIKIPDHFSTDREKIKDRQDLGTKLGEYFFIDHSGFLLDIEKNKSAAQNFTKYMEKVVNFHDQMIQFLREQLAYPEALNGLISQIQFYTKYHMSEDDLTQVIQGIIYCTSMFIDFFQQNAIQEIQNQLYRDDQSQKLNSAEKYWNQYWNSDLAKIKLKHLQVYHLKISSIYAAYGEIVQNICEKVAQQITAEKEKLNKVKKIPSRKNSQRPESKNSNLSQKSKLTQEDNLKDLENVLDSNQDLEKEQFKKPRENQAEQPTKKNEDKNKLKERLERYLKKNYDQNYQKHNNDRQ